MADCFFNRHETRAFERNIIRVRIVIAPVAQRHLDIYYLISRDSALFQGVFDPSLDCWNVFRRYGCLRSCVDEFASSSRVWLEAKDSMTVMAAALRMIGKPAFLPHASANRLDVNDLGAGAFNTYAAFTLQTVADDLQMQFSRRPDDDLPIYIFPDDCDLGIIFS